MPVFKGEVGEKVGAVNEIEYEVFGHKGDVPTGVGYFRVSNVDGTPTDSSHSNGSYLISYNAAGDAVYVDEIIGATTYRTTFTRSDMAVTSTLPISAVVAQ
jgi:hypothetical protein